MPCGEVPKIDPDVAAAVLVRRFDWTRLIKSRCSHPAFIEEDEDNRGRIAIDTSMPAKVSPRKILKSTELARSGNFPSTRPRKFLEVTGGRKRKMASDKT